MEGHYGPADQQRGTPNFTADSTQGKINFHEWIGNGWAILFSHPKDFTPVCTTELGYMAGLKPEFDKRNCQIIGLSVDPVDDHKRWSKDIQETQGHAVTYPMIGDPELKVAKAYDMPPEESGSTSQGRTAADNATVRSVFVIGPDKKVKAMLTYPMSTGRNFGAAAAGLLPADSQAQGGHARELEAGSGCHHRPRRVRRGREEDVSRGLEGAEAVSANRAAAEVGGSRAALVAVSAVSRRDSVVQAWTDEPADASKDSLSGFCSSRNCWPMQRSRSQGEGQDVD